MARLFVSYARRDAAVVVELVNELREMGHDAFYDQDLTGGQRWWDVLLDRIDASDAFLPVLSEAYADSEACRLEAEWANQVGVPIIPLDFGNIRPELCDPHIAQANWIRYGLDDRTSVARLARALNALVARTPPAMPLTRPPVPVTYLTATRQEIRDSMSLSVERQLTIITTLRSKLGTDEDGSARSLLVDLRRRPDVAYASAVEIDSILNSRSESGRPPPLPAEAGARGRSWTVAFAAAAAILVVAVGTGWVVSRHGDGGSQGAAGPDGHGSAGMSMPPDSKTSGDLLDRIDRINAEATDDPLPPSSCEAMSKTEVMCTNPVAVISSVDFKLYANPEDLYAAYEKKVAQVSGAPLVLNQHDCSKRDISGELSWNHSFRHSRRYSMQQLIDDKLDPDHQAAGRVYCGTADNIETMVWTQNPTLLAVASGTPPRSVIEWWRGVHHLIACIDAKAMPNMPACQDPTAVSSSASP